MRRAGSASWSIRVDDHDQHLEWALWIRAAERIPVHARAAVTGPADIDPPPEPSLASGEPLADSWLWWWRTSLERLQSTRPPAAGDMAAVMATLNAFGPPDFAVLADHPALRDVVAARWSEANAWHSARKGTVVEALRALRDGGTGVEGATVRAVERELGHVAAPFTLRIIVLPVLDDQIRDAGELTYLVPQRMRATNAYQEWLHQVVRTLA